MILSPRIASIQLRDLSPRQLSMTAEKREARIIVTPTRPFVITESAWTLHANLTANIQKHLAQYMPSVPESIILEKIANAKVALNTEQQKAIFLSCRTPCSILNGGPGTGKSTTLATMAAAIKTYEPHRRIVVAAFSARIAETTATKCNAEPQTLHALTGIKPGATDKMETRKETLDESIGTIIIDEAFSAEPVLLAALFALATPRQRIILAGDPAQILPIGDGRALHDLMRTNIIPSTTLRHGHRLAKSPHLAEQIERIKAGKEPFAGPGLNIRHEKIMKSSHRHQIKVRCAIEIHTHQTQSGIDHTIITQNRVGDCGYHTINRQITRRDKPDVGDRIITTQKWPLKNRDWDSTANRWHNGSCGQITDRNEKDIQILFDNGDLVTAPAETSCLEFTHAISGHRAQGLEYQAATLLIDKTSAQALNRQYLVSALSRAPHMTIITDPGLLKMAAAKDGLTERCPTIPAVKSSLT